MSHPRPDPHTDSLLDALPRHWTPPANDWRVPQGVLLAPARSVGYGVLFGVLLWGALALVAWWLWR